MNNIKILEKMNLFTFVYLAVLIAQAVLAQESAAKDEAVDLKYFNGNLTC